MTVIAKRVPLIQPTKEFSHSESPQPTIEGRKCQYKDSSVGIRQEHDGQNQEQQQAKDNGKRVIE